MTTNDCMSCKNPKSCQVCGSNFCYPSEVEFASCNMRGHYHYNDESVCMKCWGTYKK